MHGDLGRECAIGDKEQTKLTQRTDKAGCRERQREKARNTRRANHSRRRRRRRVDRPVAPTSPANHRATALLTDKKQDMQARHRQDIHAGG